MRVAPASVIGWRHSNHRSAIGTLRSPPPLRSLGKTTQLCTKSGDEISMTEKIQTLRAAATEESATPAVPVDRSDRAPLSPVQERLWLSEQIDPGSRLYTLRIRYWIDGELDVATLQRAMCFLTDRHEILRTTFEQENGHAFQRIHRSLPPDFSVVDLSPLSAVDREYETARHVQVDDYAPFDLTKGPLFRGTVLILGPGQYLLLINFHHLVTDGWSMAIFAEELRVAYAALKRGASVPLPEMRTQYADYARWGCGETQRGAVARQLGYWKKRLEGAPRALELPTDRPRRAKERAHRGAVVTAQVNRTTVDRLLATASKTRGATLYMVLLATFGVLLARQTGQRDVVVATPVANRRKPAFTRLIGFFMNTLPMRLDLSGSGFMKNPMSLG
jgi:hypothetical protein